MPTACVTSSKVCRCLVVEEVDAVGEADGEVGVAVVVEVSGGASEAGACEIVEACGLRDVLQTVRRRGCAGDGWCHRRWR